MLTAVLVLAGSLSSNARGATREEAIQVFDKIWPLWCEARALQLQGQNVTDPVERNRLAEQWYAKMDEVQQQTREDKKRFEAIAAALSKKEQEQVMQYFQSWPSRCAGTAVTNP